MQASCDVCVCRCHQLLAPWYFSKLACSLEPSEVLIVWPTATASLLVVQTITSPCVISISCQCHQTAAKSGSESCFTTTACGLAGKEAFQLHTLSNAFYILSRVLHHLTGHTSKVFGHFFRAWGGDGNDRGSYRKWKRGRETLWNSRGGWGSYFHTSQPLGSTDGNRLFLWMRPLDPEQS